MIIYGTRKENGRAGQILISLVADPEMVIQAVLSFNTNCHIIIHVIYHIIIIHENSWAIIWPFTLKNTRETRKVVTPGAPDAPKLTTDHELHETCRKTHESSQ